MTHFVPCNEAITAEETARVFLEATVRRYGLPNKIISDRDPRFTSKFIQELCRTLGIQQNISSAYHPRTDGQSERNNQWVETYLRFFTNHRQTDWATHLPLAEFAHNNWRNETTKNTPFFLLMGYHPRADGHYAASSSPLVEQRLDDLLRARKDALTHMTRAQQSWVKHRDTPKYEVGDRVWLDGRNLRTDQPTSKLAPRRHGPFTISQVMSSVSYRLELPHQWRIHPVFHIDLLTPYRETKMHGDNYQRPPPELIDNEEEFEVEAILDSRRFGRGRKLQYLVKWLGYPSSDNQWEDADKVHANELIGEFQRQHPGKETHLRAGRAAKSSPSSFSQSMSSPDSFELELDITPVPVLDAVTEACNNFPTPEPARLSPDSTHTVRVDLDPGTQVEGGEDDEGSKSVGEGATPTGTTGEGISETMSESGNHISRGGTGGPPSYCHCDAISREYCHCLERCGTHWNDSCSFRHLYLRCAMHATRCRACHEPIDRCECDPLPIPPPRRSDVVVDARGPRPIIVNDVLAAINAATARAQSEEAAALQRAEEETEGASKTGTAVEVRVGRRGNRGGQAARRGRGARAPGPPHPHHEARPPRLPEEFWANVPPRFVPFNVWHNGREVVAKYMTINMTNDPYALGTMGAGCPIFRRPAHVAPRLTDQEVEDMDHQNTRILLPDYVGRDWVDDALIRLRNDGLKAEVHRYRKLNEELKRKLEEVRILEDRIADIYLEVSPCTKRLLKAEAVERVKSQRGEAVQLISPWTFERGRSA